MKPCPEYDVLLTEDAAEALPPAEAARVEAHLATCAACRAERDAIAAALRGAALPPVSELEKRSVADLPETALAALRRSERRRWVGTRLALGALAACAAFLLVYGGSAPRPEAVERVASAVLDSAEPSAPPGSGRTEGEGVGPSIPDSVGEATARSTGERAATSTPERARAVASVELERPTVRPHSTGSGQASTGAGRTDQIADDPARADEPSPFFRGPPRAAIRLGPAPQADSPTANGFAPAIAGERAARRWEGPDLELLWEDTDVLDLEGGLDL